jgi:hypothetical protein
VSPLLYQAIRRCRQSRNLARAIVAMAAALILSLLSESCTPGPLLLVKVTDGIDTITVRVYTHP